MNEFHLHTENAWTRVLHTQIKVLKIPGSRNSSVFITQIIVRFVISLFVLSVSKPLYLKPLPLSMWTSQGHMLLCLCLSVTTFAYMFAHYNIISLRSRPCNRSYQEWHRAVLFSKDLSQLGAVIVVVVRIQYLSFLVQLSYILCTKNVLLNALLL